MKLRRLAGTTAFALLLGAGAARAQTRIQADYHGAAALGLELRRLGQSARILMIGAHPDDENNPLLTLLARGYGADVAYLSLTRGEGGQDAIGPDFQEALGIIRTEELLAARRMDGAGQFFGREYDFGFSKTAAETFQHWPRDSVLSDVVRVIRSFRPDIVISVWTGTPRDGHGHHQVSGIVAKEAFSAAADPARFPGQLREGLAPWAARKLYEGAYFTLDSATIRFATGEIDPLLGLSYAEQAAISRGRHRSQDQGQALPLGPRAGGLRLMTDLTGPAPAGPHAEASVFQGVDTTLAQRATRAGAGSAVMQAAAAYDSAVAAARAAFDPLRPGAVLAPLARAASALARIDSAGAGERLRPYLAGERQDLTAALADVEGVVFDAVASSEQVVPGDSVDLTLTLWNGGRDSLRLAAMAPDLPAGWTVRPLGATPPPTLAPGALASAQFRAVVPRAAPVTEPYYLRLPRQGDLYTWPAGDSADALPFQPAAFRAHASVTGPAGPLALAGEITFRAVSGRDGEIRRPVRIVPALSLEMERPVLVRPLSAGAPLQLGVRVMAQAPRGGSGVLRLLLPPGWRASPDSVALSLAAGEPRAVRFVVTLPSGLPQSAYPVSARFRDGGGAVYERGFRLIDYPHIRPHPLYRDARTLVQAVDVTVPRGLRVGYIMGAGDEVPAALAQLGLAVQTLAPGTLATADLARFDDIVVGIRAYEVRPELVAANPRLLEWVRAGGTLIVQYQQAAWAQAGLPPYPLTFSPRGSERVTDETAPVTVVAPASAALMRPNRIGPADWEGWVQERGLWFPRAWDAHYLAPLAMSDPGEAALRGGLLIAPYGKGTFVYTGLSFFRQLPAGVPGAYRLFANLLALGRAR